MVVTKINIKPHLAEYMRAKFWDSEIQAVRLPDKDDLYITIYNLTSKRPANAGIDDGNLPIAIPHRREGKNPNHWNYLGVRATVQIESLIEVRFWAELHQYLDEQKHRYNIDYIASIEVFMNRYDIQSISDEALRKNYYRWKRSLRPTAETRSYRKKRRPSVSFCPLAENSVE